MKRPLEGITVVGLEQVIAGPFCTRQLAELGARVIKIERPGGGDAARGYDRTVKGQSSHFVWVNRSKESFSLDVKHPGARPVLERLVQKADIAAGMYAFSSILAALYRRTREGIGATLDITMFESLGEWMGFPAYFTAYGGEAPPRPGAHHATIVPYGPFKARDRWREVGTPGGPIEAMKPPFNLDRFEPRMDAVPAPGAHSRAILAEMGFTAAEIQGMEAAGIIQQGETA